MFALSFLNENNRDKEQESKPRFPRLLSVPVSMTTETQVAPACVCWAPTFVLLEENEV